MGNTSEDKGKRNVSIGLLAHVDAGKTTLSEALLYTAGAIRKLGRVDHRMPFWIPMNWREIEESQFFLSRR